MKRKVRNIQISFLTRASQLFYPMSPAGFSGCTRKSLIRAGGKAQIGHCEDIGVVIV